jgi:hypothetical protein
MTARSLTKIDGHSKHLFQTYIFDLFIFLCCVNTGTLEIKDRWNSACFKAKNLENKDWWNPTCFEYQVSEIKDWWNSACFGAKNLENKDRWNPTCFEYRVFEIKDRWNSTCFEYKVFEIRGRCNSACFGAKKKRVITFSPHQLPAIVNMLPWTDTSTKREHPTTNFTYFAPLRQGITLTWMEYSIFGR